MRVIPLLQQLHLILRYQSEAAIPKLTVKSNPYAFVLALTPKPPEGQEIRDESITMI